jgi:hypothetical protein
VGKWVGWNLSLVGVKGTNKELLAAIIQCFGELLDSMCMINSRDIDVYMIKSRDIVKCERYHVDINKYFSKFY